MDRGRGIGILFLGGLVALLAAAVRVADRASPPWPGDLALPRTREEILASGGRVVRDRGCEYCHRTEPGTPVEHPRANCQDCHAREGIADFLALPLARIAERRPGDWLRRFLRYPYPVRSNQPSRMPDLDLSDFEVEVLALYLEELGREQVQRQGSPGPEREESPDPARLAEGRRCFEEKGCAKCHAMGDSLPSEAISVEARAAPDLTLAWQRVRPGWLAGAIREGHRSMPWSAMPDDPAMGEEDARLLAWYVANAVPSPRPEVSYGEVQRIFDERCLACHYGPRADPPPTANPEGGAGWLATWGRHPRKLSLESYEDLVRGSTDDLGLRRPVVVRFAANSPLLAHLSGAKHPAMPFGLPPLPRAEYEKVEAWVLSGARGPSEQGGVTVHPPIEVGPGEKD
ncbi:MAG: hypothetical protein HY720_26465 [Planctomycetes bacterium]|nr:hypothetical protein [Planctomycetota bacterium]